MNYNEALNYIHSLPRFCEAGLHRIKAIMNVLHNPQDKLRFIHIAGTNGKGSVSAMTASVLCHAGYKTGLFISPFITCFRERIQVNGEYISESDLARLATRVKDTGLETNEFEFITAVAFLYYMEQGCDVVVLETGLGGRLDATNIINTPVASVITGIGLDHTEILGDTAEKIAKEKCGIIKNAPVFTTYNQPADAMRVIRSYNNVNVTDEAELTVLESSLYTNRFVYREEEYMLGLIGAYQIENAMLAIDALKGCGLSLTEDNIKTGLKNTTFPARLERVSDNPIVLIDGAHNPHGARSLLKTVKDIQNLTLVLGMMEDKDSDEFLSIIAPIAKKIITVTVEGNPRTMTADRLREKSTAYCKNVTSAQNYEEALSLAGKDNPVLIAGSLYLASEIRTVAKNFYTKQ